MTPAVWAQPAPLLSVPVTVGIMLGGYLLLMGYLALALRTMRRRPGPPPAERRGWPGLVRKVVGTAVGGYLLLMAVVVGYYQGVARVAGPFLASAFTGCALLVGISLPVFLGASWLEERWRRRRSGRDPEG
ncbi:DUF6256 family protein [Kitasatospora sp. NPDC051914]|uniref:DUF6256 family protein n=1 Tax=Kitasatospora sp. NPDC051914 TaxID=3154945 RepID=UPI00343B3C6F